MTKLSEHSSSKFVKLMFMGNSGTGKTGALTSLVAAGYELRILDMDNGLDVLVAFINKECPQLLSSVDYETIRDKYVAGAMGPKIQGGPKAYVEACKLMTKWSDDTEPCEWGEKTVFVLDSLSSFSRACYAWADGMNPMAKDKRQVFFQAQQSLENILAMLTSDAFKCNVIINAHVRLTELPDGTTKGFANAIGKALGPIIPAYFNTLILAESKGMGQNVTRTIRTIPTPNIDLKSPVPFKLDATLPLGTGLATLFEQLKKG